MSALVHFLWEFGNAKHAILVRDIREFDPENEHDFSNRARYTDLSTDDVDHANIGECDIQIILLGGTKAFILCILEYA